MESRPKRRSIPASSAAPAHPEDSTEDSQVGVMGNVVESLRRKQEEASTRRQLLILRSKLEKEIRESEVPPSVAVSSEEEAPDEPTEEPPEKPTEEIAEESTEKPTEELAEEPTEKPTKELAKEDGESDEDAWGRWRWPAEDASSSWHGTTAPMEPPEGPSVDALGRQKERDAAHWTGPTTALGRSSIWYDPEAEEETVVPEGGAKKKKKKKKKQAWESAPVEGAAVEEVPETPPPSEEQLQVQRIQELFQTFGPEEAGDLPVEGEMESSSPTVDVLAVPTEPAPTTMGPTVPLEPVPETEDAGGEAKKKKRKRRKKKASQACAGDVVMVEEDPAESAGGVGDIDLGAEDAGGVGDVGVESIDVESAGPVDQKKQKKKKGARSWYHRLTPKRTPLWYHRLVCRSSQKKRRKKKGVRKTVPVEEPPEEEGELVPEMVQRVPEMVPRVPEMVPLTPAPFPPPAPLELWRPMVVAASQGLKPKPSASPRVRVRASAALPRHRCRHRLQGMWECMSYLLQIQFQIHRVLVPKPRDQARCRSAWLQSQRKRLPCHQRKRLLCHQRKRLLGHQRKLLPKGSASVQCQFDAGLPSSVCVREKKVFCAASWASFVAKVWFSVGRVASAVRKG